MAAPRRQDALDYHAQGRPGKIQVSITIQISNLGLMISVSDTYHRLSKITFSISKEDPHPSIRMIVFLP